MSAIALQFFDLSFTTFPVIADRSALVSLSSVEDGEPAPDAEELAGRLVRLRGRSGNE